MTETLEQKLERAEIAAKLKGSLLLFIQAFFPILTGREFIISKPVGRESHFITVCRALTKCTRLQALRLLINIPPGHAKSTIVSFWIAWCYTKWPDCNFLYISYSKTLAANHTDIIKRIMSLRQYKAIFGIHLRDDSQAKDSFTTEAGGTVGAFGSAGAITGHNAGLPGLDRFSGAVVCFPYDEYVQTESGPIKIGDIVIQKMNLKVYSIDLKTREVELKPIIGYFENPGSPVIEIEFNDGAILRCTPEHKIWTDNRGWVEAQNLLTIDNLPSPSQDSTLRDSNQFSGHSLRYSEIIDNVQLLLSKICKFATNYIPGHYCPSLSSFISSTIPSSNFLDSHLGSPKFFCQNTSAQGTHDELNNFFSAKSSARMISSHGKCTMINRIKNVFGTCSISKIFRSIVKSIPINMTSIISFGLFPMKSPSNQLMHENISSYEGRTNSSPKIFARGIDSKFFDFLRCGSITSIISVINDSWFRANSSKTRRAIKSIKSGNKSPLFIRHIGHIDKSYCINVEENHNFFCGTSEDKCTLVRNCDDMHKPDEIHSDLIREGVITNFRETIQQRPRGINVPIIFIGQRLHEQDLPAYFLSGEDGYTWDTVILKSIDDAGNALYPEAFPLDMLKIRADKDRYVFAAQHQQDPQPSGGGLYLEDDFPLLADEPNNYLCTFITADTAETDDPRNDATVFSFWGYYSIQLNGESTGMMGLHWINCIEIRVEPKNLENEFLEFYRECAQHHKPPLVAFIEKKSTGVTLISVLKNMRGLKIREIERTRKSGSKCQRFIDIQPYIAAKQVSLPAHGEHTQMCIRHMKKITNNDSHAHDDIADTCSDAVRLALIERQLYAYTHSLSNHSEVALIAQRHWNRLQRLKDRAYMKRN